MFRSSLLARGFVWPQTRNLKKIKEKKKKKKKLDPLNQVVTQSPAADTGCDACITHSLNSLALKNTNICRIITGSINVMTKGVPSCFPPGHQRFSVLLPLNSNNSHVEHECVCVCLCARIPPQSPPKPWQRMCFFFRELRLQDGARRLS